MDKTKTITVRGAYGNHNMTTTIRCKDNGVYLYTTRRAYNAALGRLGGPTGDYLSVVGSEKGGINVLGHDGQSCWTVM